MERINIDGDYLLIAPKIMGGGYHHMLSERAYLADNIQSFIDNYKANIHAITIFELKEINEQCASKEDQ